MEPHIQYAKTSDGVSIAFWSIGEGPPLLWMPSPPISHIQMEWEWPLARRAYEKLAERRRVIRFDWRGSGLSDRDSPDSSVETNVLDIEAVIEKLKLEQLILLGVVESGPAAITYATRHPEKVSHLILWGSFAHGGFGDDAQVQGLVALLDKDWQMFCDALAHSMFGWSNPETASFLARFMAGSSTAEAVKSNWEASFQANVTDILPQVSAPTLVIHPSSVAWVDKDQSRLLASRIPNARLQVIEDKDAVLLFDDALIYVTAIESFLSETDDAAKPPAAASSGTAATTPAPGAFRTVLWTDLVGHTQMMQRLGDAKGRDVLREHERITREVLKQHGGTEVKTMGDGFMASFGSVTKAVECAIALQRAFAEREGEPLNVRVGLNAGEPIEEDGDLFGATVILASRIAAKAEGGEILVADTVRGLCSGKGFLFADRGDQALKGFEEPVRISEVNWRS